MCPPAFQGSPNSPTVDLQRLEEVCMADPASMLELAEFFFSQAEQEMALLNLAIEQSSPEEVRRLSHRLLGASAGCGMVAMAQLLAELEQNAKAGNLDTAGEVFSLLIDSLALSRNEVASWHSRIQS